MRTRTGPAPRHCAWGVGGLVGVCTSIAIHRTVLPVLFCSLLCLAGCDPADEQRAAEARQLGDYRLATQLYMTAALDVVCPDKARILILKAEVQELDDSPEEALQTLDSAVRSCPDYTEARWARAQRYAQSGDREGALLDLEKIRNTHPEGASMHSEISMEMEAERSVRSRSHSRVLDLRATLDVEAPDRKLRDRAGTQLARRIPVPVTLKYQIEQNVRSPKAFELAWEETLSYRGDPAANEYLLVRSLEVPPLPNNLPTYYRLQLANQRLPMRFEVDATGKITEAGWLRNGPGRGIRPSVLAPEIAGMLKRRRLFEPGGGGLRGPGDRWSGEDVRLVDAKPVALEYEAEALSWTEVLGIRTLHIRARLRGEGYEGEEEIWIHPSTAVPVRWVRQARYAVAEHRGEGSDRWDESRRGTLISISGVN